MNSAQYSQYSRFFNILDLLGVCLVSLMAFGFQFLLHELPCPLCLMQRLGVLAMGFGFLLNIHYRPAPGHYALVLLASIFTSFVAMRQILDHIVPGTGAYGAPFLGYHLYTWTFIFAMLMMLYTSLMLSIPGQYLSHTKPSPGIQRLSHLSFLIFLIVLLANGLSLYLECGWLACPDNPVHYHAFG